MSNYSYLLKLLNKNDQAMINKYGTTAYNRYKSYYETKAALEENGIDQNKIAPNYKYMDVLFKNEGYFKNKYGESEYNKLYNKYNAGLKDEISRINQAAKLKQSNYTADVLDASTELKKRFTYDLNDEEDVLRQAIGIVPKSFNKSVVNDIIKKAREYDASQNTETDPMKVAKQIPPATSNLFATLPVDENVSKEQLLEAIAKLNKASQFGSVAETKAIQDKILGIANNIQNRAQAAQQKAVQAAQNLSTAQTMPTAPSLPVTNEKIKEAENILIALQSALDKANQKTATSRGIPVYPGITPTEFNQNKQQAEILKQEISKQQGEVTALKNQQYYDNLANIRAELQTAATSAPDYQAMVAKGSVANPNIGNVMDYLNSDTQKRAEYDRPAAAAQAPYDYGKYTELTPDELNTLRYFWGKGDKASYDTYLQSIDRELDKRFIEKRNATGIENLNKAGGFGKVISGVGSVLYGYGSPLAWIESGVQTVKNAITGKYEPVNQYSPTQQAASQKSAMQEYALKDAKGIWRFLGGVGFSMADMATKLPFGPTGSLAYMASSAAGQQANEVVRRGGTPEQAFLEGGLYGVIEYVTEKMPIDNLFRLAKSGLSGAWLLNGIKAALKQAGIEATEELVSEYADTLTDIAIMGDKSEYMQRKQALIRQGMSEADATKQVNNEFFIVNPVLAAAGGAVSGGLLGGGAMVLGGMNSNVGKGTTTNVPSPPQNLDTTINAPTLPNLSGLQSRAEQVNIPPAPSISTRNVNQNVPNITGSKQPNMRTSKVATSTYEVTGDAILKKNIDMGVYDFVSQNASAQYEAKYAKMDTNEINNIINKYQEPYVDVTQRGKTKKVERQYNEQDTAEITAALAKAYEIGDTKAQQELMAIAYDMGITQGRSVNMWKMLKNMDGSTYAAYLARKIAKINAEGQKVYKSKWNDLNITATEYKRLKNSKAPEERVKIEAEIAKRIANEMPSTWTEKDAAWRRIMMLFNPVTHVRNVVGNTLMSGMIEARDKLIWVAERFVEKDQRTKAFKVKKETLQTAKKYYDEANVADQMAGVKYELGRMDVLGKQKRVFKSKALNALDNVTLSTLTFEDDLFKKSRYTKSLARFMDARGLTEVTQEAHEYAMQDALEATFQDRNAIAEAINRLKKTRGGSVVDVAVPFVKTPLNITKRAIEYSPFGLVQGGTDFFKAHNVNKEISKLNTQLESGTLTESEISKLNKTREQYTAELNNYIQKGIKSLAQGITGTGVFTLGFLLAAGALIPGISITGLAPPSDKEEEFMRSNGWQPLALKIGDNYYSLSWALPFASVLLAGAQTFHEIESKNPDIGNVGVQSLIALGDTIMNSSMLSTLRRTISSRKDFGEVALSLASDYVSQHIPTLGLKLNAITEPYLTQSYSSDPLKNLKNKAIMTIPGLRQGLGSSDTDIPENVNVWGQKTSSGDLGQRILNNLVYPWTSTKGKDDSVNTELLRLSKAVNDRSVLPRVLDTTSLDVADARKLLGKDIRLTDSEVAQFQEWVGQASRIKIENLLSSSAYKSMDDNAKKNAINKIYEDVVNHYRSVIIKIKAGKAPALPNIKR
jgi:hypothetical protein